MRNDVADFVADLVFEPENGKKNGNKTAYREGVFAVLAILLSEGRRNRHSSLCPEGATIRSFTAVLAILGSLMPLYRRNGCPPQNIFPMLESLEDTIAKMIKETDAHAH